ncbi:hypothetical protein F4604DRAFT_1914286 [Suillus subluteus]|nr:hypothetical protein F4604DRAFT_1914286 [Suillus subluteus]
MSKHAQGEVVARNLLSDNVFNWCSIIEFLRIRLRHLANTLKWGIHKPPELTRGENSTLSITPESQVIGVKFNPLCHAGHIFIRLIFIVVSIMVGIKVSSVFSTLRIICAAFVASRTIHTALVDLHHGVWVGVKTVLKRYRIRRALASARALCPLPETSGGWLLWLSAGGLPDERGKLPEEYRKLRRSFIRCIGSEGETS